MDDPTTKTPPAATDPAAAPPAEPAADPAAPLGEPGLKALQIERAARKSAETELTQLRAEIRDSEAATMRAEVARAHRLPPALGRRLVGTTREELDADALEIEAALRPAFAPTPKEALLPGAVPSAGEAFKPSSVVDELLSR